MPWTPDDAARHNSKIKSDRHARMWSDIANSILSKTGDEGRAIAGANSQVDIDINRARVGSQKTASAAGDRPFGSDVLPTDIIDNPEFTTVDQGKVVPVPTQPLRGSRTIRDIPDYPASPADTIQERFPEPRNIDDLAREIEANRRKRPIREKQLIPGTPTDPFDPTKVGT